MNVLISYRIYFQNKFFLFLALFFIYGCSGTVNNFSNFYNDEGLETSEFIKADASENVTVIETADLEKKITEYQKKGYVSIGFSHFKGPWCPRALAIDTAKEKGASIVIISSIHLDDVEYSYAIPYSVPHTTYYEGSVSSHEYTSGYVNNRNGVRLANYNATTTGYSSFRGSSTYYTTSYITDSYTVGYFEQSAFFLAKSNEN